MRAVMEHVDLDVDAGIARFESNDFAVKKFVGVSDLVRRKGHPHRDFEIVGVHRPCGRATEQRGGMVGSGQFSTAAVGVGNALHHAVVGVDALRAIRIGSNRGVATTVV